MAVGEGVVGAQVANGTAMSDVQNLNPTADAEDGYVAVECGVDEPNLELVALPVGARAGVGVIRVERGVHVATASQQECVDLVERAG